MMIMLLELFSHGVSLLLVWVLGLHYIPQGYAFHLTHPIRFSTRKFAASLPPTIPLINSDILLQSSSQVKTRKLCHRWCTSTSTMMMKQGQESFESPRLSPLKDHTLLVPDENLVRGKLDNGLEYIILPNNVPENRFEAHLAILSGSLMEMEHQQGIAHVVEHVSYMGAPRRHLLHGTGSRTNAYTDFHTTVFFASCPINIQPSSSRSFLSWLPSPNKEMFPLALDAFVDIMEAKVSSDRLEMERSAVLSEVAMVGKLDVRVECQILASLHKENRVPNRIPVGKVDQIRSWTTEDVQYFHDLHYRPDNAVLFVVGGLDPKTTVSMINKKLGNLKPRIPAWQQHLQASREFPSKSMQSISRHYPPLVHRWSCPLDVAKNILPKHEQILEEIDKTVRANDTASSGLTIFQHPLLQNFYFHLQAKTPIQPIRDIASLARVIAKRIVINAMMIRTSRHREFFHFIELQDMAYSREGCMVGSLDFCCDISRWQDATALALREIRRLGSFGLTQGEFVRSRHAIKADTEQLIARSSYISSEELVAQLIDAESCDHVFTTAEKHKMAVDHILDNISLEEINLVAREMCEHVSPASLSTNSDNPIELATEDAWKPSSMVMVAPSIDRAQQQFIIRESEVADVINDAMNSPLPPLDDIPIMSTLLSKENILPGSQNEKMWQSTIIKSKSDSIHGRLVNNLAVNLKTLASEPRRAEVRLVIPGGMLADPPNKPGLNMLGCATIQEGGAFGNVTREEVELFCILHNVLVEVKCEADHLRFDFSSNSNSASHLEISGLEAILQVVNIILTKFRFEKDAFQRAKRNLYDMYDYSNRQIENKCEMMARNAVLSGYNVDANQPSPSAIDSITMEEVTSAMTTLLRPEVAEITISADIEMPVLLNLTNYYLGSIETTDHEYGVSNSQLFDGIERRINRSMTAKEDASPKTESAPKGESADSRSILVHVPDNDVRAVGYLSGVSPNVWGKIAMPNHPSQVFDISSLMDDIQNPPDNIGRSTEHRKHPLFGRAVQLVFQEMASRRLFQVVRTERMLTYDADWTFHGFDFAPFGNFLVRVVSTPTQIDEALLACRDALRSMSDRDFNTASSVESARLHLVSKHQSEGIRQRYWVDLMRGVQLGKHQQFNLAAAVDGLVDALESITVDDIHDFMLVLRRLNQVTDVGSSWVDNGNLVQCIGITAPAEGAGIDENNVAGATEDVGHKGASSTSLRQH